MALWAEELVEASSNVRGSENQTLGTASLTKKDDHTLFIYLVLVSDLCHG